MTPVEMQFWLHLARGIALQIKPDHVLGDKHFKAAEALIPGEVPEAPPPPPETWLLWNTELGKFLARDGSPATWVGDTDTVNAYRFSSKNVAEHAARQMNLWRVLQAVQV